MLHNCAVRKDQDKGIEHLLLTLREKRAADHRIPFARKFFQ